MGKWRPIFNMIVDYSKKRRNIVIFELFCHYKAFFLGTETGHWRMTVQAERGLFKQDRQCSSAMMREIGGLLRQEREAIRPLCLDPSWVDSTQHAPYSPQGPLRPCGALRHVLISWLLLPFLRANDSEKGKVAGGNGKEKGAHPNVITCLVDRYTEGGGRGEVRLQNERHVLQGLQQSLLFQLCCGCF